MNAEFTPASVRSILDPLNFSGKAAAEDEWLKAYRPILFWACFNAFELKRHPARGLTHVLVVILELSPRAVAGKVTRPKKMFNVSKTLFVSNNEFARIWPPSIELRADQDRVQAARPDDIRVGSCMAIRFSDDAYRFWLLKWDHKELEDMREDRNWESVLMSVTMGKKEYEMVSGNPMPRSA